MRFIALALVNVAIFSSAGRAAVIHVTPKIGAVLNQDFTPLDPAMVVSRDDFGIVLRPNAGRYIAQIDFLMTITDLQPGQIGFGNAAVNIDLAGEVRNSVDLPGWLPDRSRVDSNGPDLGGVVLKWASANGCDCGIPDDPLHNILIKTAPRNFNAFVGDPRRTLGLAPYNNDDAESPLGPVTNYGDGEYFGSILVDVDSLRGSAGSVSGRATQGSVYDATQTFTAAGVTGSPAQAVSFSIVPEPTSVALVTIALLAFIALGRLKRSAHA